MPAPSGQIIHRILLGARLANRNPNRELATVMTAAYSGRVPARGLGSIGPIIIVSGAESRYGPALSPSSRGSAAQTLDPRGMHRAGGLRTVGSAAPGTGPRRVD